MSLFTSLPKTDLHCHLDGSLRMETLCELADMQGIRLPALPGSAAYDSLEQYLQAFAITCSVMQTADAIARVAFELIEDAALDNVKHIEVRFCPTFLTEQGLSHDEVIEAALHGMGSASGKYGISTGLILCAMRNSPPTQSLAIAKLAITYRRRGVVALDLAGPEAGYPAKAHAESFREALRHGLHTTVHAGEGDGAESIRQALVDCGAQRIGHGVRVVESSELLDEVIKRQIPLEVCLSSNVQTGVVASMDNHPLRRLYDLGAKVTINTDNRLISHTTMSGELLLAHEHLGFSQAELTKLISNGADSAFLSASERLELHGALDVS